MSDTTTRRTRILHVAELADWNQAQLSGNYKPLNFDTDGFTHCCFAEQLTKILETYYADRSDYVILELTSNNDLSELKIETSSDGDEYPHVYGSIPLTHLAPFKR